MILERRTSRAVKFHPFLDITMRLKKREVCLYNKNQTKSLSLLHLYSSIKGKMSKSWSRLKLHRCQLILKIHRICYLRTKITRRAHIKLLKSTLLGSMVKLIGNLTALLVISKGNTRALFPFSNLQRVRILTSNKIMPQIEDSIKNHLFLKVLVENPSFKTEIPWSLGFKNMTQMTTKSIFHSITGVDSMTDLRTPASEMMFSSTLVWKIKIFSKFFYQNHTI